MISHSGDRYICHQCEAWDVPGTTLTAEGLFVARVHLVKRCPVASAELKTHLLELELEIDKIPGDHDVSYLTYLNNYTLDRLPSSTVSLARF